MQKLCITQLHLSRQNVNVPGLLYKASDLVRVKIGLVCSALRLFYCVSNRENVHFEDLSTDFHVSTTGHFTALESYVKNPTNPV